MTENRSPLSTAELERRWAAVRAAMQAEGLDALVMQNRSDWVGGYVRWFTDIPATNGYPRTLIFPAEGPMAVIGMGAFGEVADLRGSDPVHRGIGRMISTPSFMSIDYTTGYDAELAIAELTRLGARRIGLIVPGGLPADLWRAVTTLPGVETVNATDLVDRIKAIKSPEEIALIRATCALQDQVFAAVLEGIRPGLTDADVSALAEAGARRLGSDQGIFLCSSARLGQAARFKPRQLQGRRIEAGDHYSLLIEVNGPGGLYAEIARTIVLGRAPERLKEHFATVLAAQDHTLALMKPGADPVEIAAAHDDWLRAHGLPPETRLYAHGQGTDMVERPMLRRDETMRLAENMNLAVHPGYDDGTVFAVVCDNYLIGPDGPGACLHGTEKRIFETA